MADAGEEEAQSFPLRPRGLASPNGPPEMPGPPKLPHLPDFSGAEDEDAELRSSLRSLTLHQAARDGNVELMRRLLDANLGRKKINAHDENKLTPLHYGARFNNYEICSLLLSKGADANNQGEDLITPLHSAVKYKRSRRRRTGDEETEDEEAEDEAKSVVKLLVDQGGANVNSRDLYGLTPLHFASMRGNEFAVQALLQCPKIDIEAHDKQDITPLHMAANYNHYNIAKMLINAGSNLRSVDEDMSTPLHLAASEGNERIVKLLFAAGERKDGWVTINSMVTDLDSEKSTALHLAVENKHYSVVKLILEKGADVNAAKQGFTSPLHLAASAGDVPIVKLLLDYKCRIDAQNSKQATPLHKAAAYNHCAVIRYLLSRGARIEQTDSDSFTPLLTAASYGNPDAVELLLSCGANVNHLDKNEKTALFWAAEEDNLSVVKVLLQFAGQSDDVEAGVLVDQPDRFSNTPLHIAARKGYTAVVKELLDNEADLDAKNEEEQTPLHLAAIHGRTNACRELLRRNKLAVHDEDENSDTPLHHAATYGHHKVAQALLDNGADVEARNSVLWTPLDCAAAKGFVKVAKVLVAEDAPIDPSDRNKTTPLHLAGKFGHVEMVQYLLKAGADVSKRNLEGSNTLDLAIDNNRKDVATAILKSAHWEAALRNDTVDVATGHRSTPMRKLIKKMPDVAETLFYRCSSNNDYSSEHPKFAITFNYEFLDDTYSNWAPVEAGDTTSQKSGESTGTLMETYNEDGKLLHSARTYTNASNVLKENSPLNIMVTSKREDLLAHPLVTALLRHKWTNYGIYIYYVNLSVYLLFLLMITGYMLCSQIPFNLIFDKASNVSECDQYERQLPPKNVPKGAYFFFVEIGRYIALGMAGLFILRELVQICFKRLSYVSVENLLELSLYALSVLFVVDFNECQIKTAFRTNWQWQCGVVAVFLAWIDLVLFIRKLPRFGIYVVMFTNILKTFLNFFIVFFLFIIAFGLTFYALFQNQEPFENPGESLLKTFVMMIGEFEFDDIFNKDGALKYPAVSYPLFIVFLVVMSILIMNLLVGLAVDDIKAVQEKATLQRMAMQIELALDVESLLPRFISRKFVVKTQTIYPNRKGKSLFSRLFGSEAETSTEVAEKLNQSLDPIEVVQENQERMESSIKNLKVRMKSIQEQNDNLKNMMCSVMKHLDVSYLEEDNDDSDAG